MLGGATVKLLRWAVFGVSVPLLPLLCSYVFLFVKAQPVTWSKILGNGELLVIVWALCAGAIGELFGSSANFRHFKIVSGGFTLIILIFAALMFAGVAEAKLAGAGIDEARLVWTSSIVLLFGLVGCGSCILLSET